jgi:hypothetical protein
MTIVEYLDVPVNSDGEALEKHIASHHVRSVPGGAELTLCGVLITYSNWRGHAPDAQPCQTCANLDA